MREHIKASRSLCFCTVELINRHPESEVVLYSGYIFLGSGNIALSATSSTFFFLNRKALCVSYKLRKDQEPKRIKKKQTKR